MQLKNIPCVVLCGGKSSRMGEDKCFLNYGGKTLACYQFEKMGEIFDEVYLSCKEDKFKGEFAKLIFDESANYSPMIALYSILKHFKNSFVFILCVDMPRISLACIEKMAKLSDKALVILPKTKAKTHFLCGFYHSSLAPLCLEFLQKDFHKIAALCQKTSCEFVEFEDESEFANLNTPQDYESYKDEVL